MKLTIVIVLIRLVPNVASFNGWITKLVGVKLPHLSVKGLSMLEDELQLANQREMRSREIEERSNQREREAHELYVEAREELKRIRESERLYKLALVLSWLFFIFVMFLLCFALMNNNVRVRTLNPP